MFRSICWAACACSSPFSVLRARKKLRELLRENEFDVVICHSAWGQAIFGPVIRAAKLPSVFWCHDVPDGRPWPERWARLTPPDLLLCNSKYTGERVPRLYKNVPCVLVYCPVEAPVKDLSNDDLGEVRSEFNTPQDAVVILQISRLEPHKGHLSHIEALGELKDLPGWVCWQVGSVQKNEERNYFEQIKATAERFQISERIKFLGWQPDVHRVMAAADIYCQPNIYPEPFGLTFIEAMFARKPVVATSIGGPKEIVDSSCGFLVAPGNAHDLAVTLRMLIENRELRQKLGVAGPQRANVLCQVQGQIRHLHDSLATVC